MSKISQNKIKHILGVARKCEILAKEKHLSKEMQDACFVMGFLHDIGYERCSKEEISNHPEKGYEMIMNFLTYKDEAVNAIKNHGHKYSDLSIFDKILNTADLTTDYQGEEIGIEERLETIKKVHGETKHYEHAVKQANALK